MSMQASTIRNALLDEANRRNIKIYNDINVIKVNKNNDRFEVVTNDKDSLFEVSVLKKAPGVAFGLTTIGLFLGTVPVFFVKFSNVINAGVIVILSIICLIILLKILKKEGSNGRC